MQHFRMILTILTATLYKKNQKRYICHQETKLKCEEILIALEILKAIIDFYYY